MLIRVADAADDLHESLRSRKVCGCMTGPGRSSNRPAAVEVDLLQGRRSTKSFGPVGIADDHVREIVEAAVGRITNLWHSANHVTILRVSRLNDRSVEATQLSTDVAQLVVRELPPSVALARDLGRYANAPTFLVFLDGSTPACDGLSNGYAEALVRSGAAMYACWLEALRFGIGACIYGRPSTLVNNYASSVLGGLRHTGTLALGFPASSA